MARPLLFFFGLGATAQSANLGEQGPYTDIYAHSHGFVMVNRNFGTAACIGINGTSDCPSSVDWNLGLGVEVYTAPTCPTVVLFDPFYETGSCFDPLDPDVSCSDVDFRGATTVILGGGEPTPGGAAVPCTGVVWDKESKDATCFGPNKTGTIDSTCGDVNFAGVTDVYANLGGGFVAFSSDTGSVQCFGHPQNGGVCPPGLVAKPGLKLYQADYAYLLYDPMLKTGVCWGDSARGGDCANVNFENVTGEIVGNKLGFVALEKGQDGMEPGMEESAECWGMVACPMSFKGVTKVIAGSSSFIALEPVNGFCFPDPCHDNMTFGLLQPILPVGPGFIGFNASSVGEPVCFGPIGAANEKMEVACASLASRRLFKANDLGSYKESNIMVAGMGDDIYIVAYGSLTPLDSELEIKSRQCYKTLPASIDASGDVLDHVVVLYGGAYGTSGTYFQKANDVFEKPDGTWSISWDGCKWQLSRTTVMVDIACEDDVFAANALFGNAFLDEKGKKKMTARYDLGICSSGALLGHCEQTVFAALCSGTCGSALADACTHDNDAAMLAYSKFNSMPPMKCAQAVELCDESAVVEAICKATCDHTDSILPTEDGKTYSYDEYNSKFFERRMFRLDGRKLAIKPGGPSYLPTADEPMFVFMGTSPAEEAASNCTATQDAVYGVSALTSTSICELSTLGKLTDYMLEKTCKISMTYDTTSYAYCPWMNVDITDSRIAAYMCSDMSERGGRDSNAICVSREMCESLCTDLGAECIGFDFVLGEDRCYLNRYQSIEEGSYCSSDMIVDGPGGIQPPESYSKSGYGFGYEQGIRYPDGHIPGARRLEHEELWSSSGMIFARKRPGTPFTPMYTTVSKMYCKNENLMYADLVNKTCDNICDVANMTGDDATFKKYGCETDGDSHDEVYCMVREECEAACTADKDCISFDMDRKFPRCWFNKACTDMVGDALYHDLVVKSPGPAPCVIEVTTTTEDGTGVVGNYTQISPTIYTNLAKITDKFTFSAGCGWYLNRNMDALYRTWEDVNCTGNDDQLLEKLYVNTCSGAPGMGATYFCERYEPCQEYGYCLLSSERMGYELTAFRSWMFDDAEPWKSPICSCTDKESIVYAFEKYKPKAVADDTRVEFVYDSLAFDGVETRPSSATAHYLHMELFRDVYMPPRVRLQTLGAAQRGVVTLVDPAADMLELGVNYGLPTGYGSWVSDIIRIELFVRGGTAVVLSDRTNLLAKGECTAPYAPLKQAASSAADCAAACDELVDCTFFQYISGTMPSWTNKKTEDAAKAAFPTLYPVSSSSAKQITNCVQVNTFAATCPEGAIKPTKHFAFYEVVQKTIAFELYIPTPGTFEKDFTLFKKIGSWWVDILADGDPKPGKTAASITPSPLTNEPGWVLVEIPDRFQPTIGSSGCGVLDLIVAMDLNECMTPGICEENALCVNQKGFAPGYSCVCKEGWVPDGKGHCIASEAYASPLVVRVENDVEMPWGWRIKEVELFSDDSCKVPLVSGVTEKFIWTKIEDRYCIGNQLAPKEVPGKSTTDVKDLESYLCQGGKNGDKAGNYDRPDKGGSNAYCMEEKDCLAKCGEDPLCIGVDVHEYLPRCYFNYNIEGALPETTCAHQMLTDTLGDDHDFRFVFKDKNVVVQASSTFTDHWGATHMPSNIIDGSMNSEWWSGLHNVAALGASVELLISGTASVGSARLIQTPRHAASRYRVSVGPQAGSLDVVGSKHVQGAEDGTFIEDRTLYTSTVVQTVENEVSPCMDLTCGDEGLRLLGTPLTKFEGAKVPTPCHCKQLCLDHVDEGCRSYSFRMGKDTNFDEYMPYGGGPCYPGGTGDCMGHTACYLYTSAYSPTAAKMHMDFTSGGVDLVLFSASLNDKGGTGDTDYIEVKAAGLPLLTTKQRIKVVFAGESCGAAPAPTVGGISCTDAYICHPKPSYVAKEMVSWAVKGRVAATKGTKAYDVCYCAGPCFAASHWTKVPGGFSVAGTATEFTVSPAAPTRYVDFKLTVAGAAATDVIALAPSQGKGLVNLEAACDGPLSLNATGGAGGVYTITKLEDESLPFGDYVVCIFEKGSGPNDFAPVPGAAGPVLTIVPEFPTDAVTVAGIFKEQQFSVMKGVPVSLAVLGSQLNTKGNSGIALSKSSSCSKAISSQIADWDHKVWVKGHVAIPETVNASDSVTYDMTVKADPGTYTICMCDGSVASGAVDNTPHWYQPNKDYLKYYGVTLGGLLHMTINGMVNNHSMAETGLQNTDTLKTIIDGLHGNTYPVQGTVDEAYYVFISAFDQSGLTFEAIADSIINASDSTTSIGESLLASELITQYTISSTDLLWLAHLATVDGPPSAELIADLRMNETFTSNFKLEDTGPIDMNGKEYALGATRVITIKGMLPAPTKKNADAKAFAVMAQATGCGAVTCTGWELLKPSWYAPTAEPFTTWEALFDYAESLKVDWPAAISPDCDSAAKYAVTVGKLVVTSKTTLGMTYVLEPGGKQSIEITGSGLKPWADRMTLVNCQDTCGVSKPSTLVGFPDGDYVGAFSMFEPVRDLSESPMDNCPYVNFTQNPYLVDTQFKRVKARYCVNASVDLMELAELSAPSAALVKRHSCAEKCTQPCVGTHCNCEGNIGLDDAFVDDAICLPKYECEHLCMILGDACHSVTVHETLPRCFLNGPACDVQVDADDPKVVASVVAAIEAAEESSSTSKGGKKPADEYDPPALRPLGLNLDYSLYVKVGSGAEPLDPMGAMDDEFESIVWSDSSRGDLVQGPGFSTQDVLRFAPLTLPSAGTYKVCFCDSEVSGSCETAADFSVEVGKVHVSGLSCLLSVPKLQTAQCFEQYFGGLRCV
jgi:hypothetical protein